MKTGSNNLLSNNIFRIAVVTVVILSIPLLAIQFSNEVNWSVEDFIIIGVLLFGMGLLYEVISKRLKNKNHRLAVGVAVLLLTMYIWAELAVGIFTSIGS